MDSLYRDWIKGKFSYNPHVRFGAAMALGIAYAGTGLKVSLVIIHM